VHFGVAREHSHAAPPKSIRTTPAGNEKILVIKRMKNLLTKNQKNREAHCRSSHDG